MFSSLSVLAGILTGHRQEMQPRTQKPNPSFIAREIASEFRNGEITYRSLNSHGISRLSVKVHGKAVELSWFSSGVPASISIDGNGSFPKGADSDRIFRAAKDRANRLMDEDLRALEDAMERK